MTRYTARGTHQGEFWGIIPTGEEVEVTDINITRIEEGKIVESWGNSDQLGMIRRLEAIP